LKLSKTGKEGDRIDKHPTPKPEQLITHFLEPHTLPGDLVLDPFGGGGTTAAACLKLGRSCKSIELDLTYHKMSQRKIADARDMFTGIYPKIKE